MHIFSPGSARDHKFGAAAFAILLSSGVAEASVINPTPTPVPANGEYAVAAPGCFTAEGVCVGPGTFSYTSVISSTFSPLGQDVVVDGVYTSEITDLSHAPLGLISMTGMGEESILGRLGPSDTGTWPTSLDSLAISGTVLGDTVSVGLDPSNPTTGQTSITAMGSDFLITSFFDVFVDITIDTASGPVTDAIGPVHHWARELTALGHTVKLMPPAYVNSAM